MDLITIKLISSGISEMNRYIRISNLFKRFCIQENPTDLNDLRRILSHIDTMLIASSGHMDDHITIHDRSL